MLRGRGATTCADGTAALSLSFCSHLSNVVSGRGFGAGAGVDVRRDRLAHRLIRGQLAAHLASGDLPIRVGDYGTGRDLPGLDLREHAPDMGLGYRSLESHAGASLWLAFWG